MCYKSFLYKSFLYISSLVLKCDCYFVTMEFGEWLINNYFKKLGTPLAVQWLGLRASTAGGAGSIPGPGSGITHAAQRSQKEEKRKKIELICQVKLNYCSNM